MKKGFTLVELSIALVVIGILMGMTIKGSAILHSARVRTEMGKIYKFRMALDIFYANNGALPSATYSSGAAIVNSQELVDAGLLMPRDLDPSYLAPEHMWYFSKMRINPDPAQNSVYQHHTEGEIVSAQPTTRVGHQGSIVPFPLVCYIELILDDSNIFRGDGRHIVGAYNSKYSTDPLASSYSKCKSAQGTFFGYAFNIFG